MLWPEAEVDIGEGLVRDLLRGQHPDLADRPLSLVGSGFDNSIWRLGDELAVRIPRRRIAVELVLNEQKWLPILAPRFTIQVPVPIRTGSPSERYPWPWSVVPWIQGRSSDSESVRDQTKAGSQLADFLNALHSEAPTDAPHNPWRSVALIDRNDTFQERLARLEQRIDVTQVGGLWERALTAPAWPGPPTWIHADLHPDNILVDDGSIAGVIDFGDLCAGDPATDLAVGWMLFDDEGRRALFDGYRVQDRGVQDRGLEQRAAGWATLFALMLLEIGVGGRPSYASIGTNALSRLAQQPG
jgi:aminoglycoside phosphotransferase (APT) family kinase protein